MKRVIITGGTGFIGAAVAAHLLDMGVEVHALVRAQSDTSGLPSGLQLHRIDGSLGQLTSIMETVRPGLVIHMASLFLAEHVPTQATELVTSNVLFATELLEAMAAAGIRNFINTGTSWQHFEKSTYRPVNLYAASKEAFDAILRYYGEVRGISHVTLKLYDTYGPGDKRRKLLNLLIQAAQAGEVLDMSPGEQILDLTYIDDVVSAYCVAMQLLENAPDLLANDYLVTGSRHTLQEVVGIVADVTGFALQVNFGGRPYRNREVMLPVRDEQKRLPGWQPQFDLKSGLGKMLS